MTAPSRLEVVANPQSINPSSLWLAFELRCDDAEIDIRAALILREPCELNGREQAHHVNGQRQATVGYVTATLCKWKGRLDLPSEFGCLLTRDGAPREALVDQCELYGTGVDVLVLERIEIEPEYRGRDIGLTATRALVRTFATGETLATLRSSPLVPAGQELSPAELREGQDKLRRYWQRAGFERFARSEILVLAPGRR